jgi:hypothetical protein
VHELITLNDAILIAIISLISSVVGALIPPLINSGIEKRKSKVERQAKLIAEWRQFIELFDFNNQHFRATTVYAAMRPYMDENERRNFEAQRTYVVVSSG